MFQHRLSRSITTGPQLAPGRLRRPVSCEGDTQWDRNFAAAPGAACSS